MGILEAIILSLVEGFTEFLPISSTGHLILTSEILRMEPTEFVKTFEVFIQLGAILAILVLYWKVLLTNMKAWIRIVSALIPTTIVGFIFYDFIKAYLLGNSQVTAISLLIGGVVIIMLEFLYKEKDHHIDKIEEISIKKAFIIGVFQSIAVVPGVSRAAATIIGGLFLGTKRKTAAEFSFLIAVPTIAGAALLDVTKTGLHSFSSSQYLLLTIGTIGSFVFAVISVKFLLSFIKTHSFIGFGVYRIIVAIIFWIFTVL